MGSKELMILSLLTCAAIAQNVSSTSSIAESGTTPAGNVNATLAPVFNVTFSTLLPTSNNGTIVTSKTTPSYNPTFPPVENTTTPTFSPHYNSTLSTDIPISDENTTVTTATNFPVFNITMPPVYNTTAVPPAYNKTSTLQPDYNATSSIEIPSSGETTTATVTTSWPVVNVTAPPPSRQPVISCNFDSNSCGFTSNKAGDFYWRRNRGSTASSSTGPINDHTTGRGYYMYTEASRRNFGDRAILESPVVNSSGEYCLSFWYHMYGRTMGTLEVKAQSYMARTSQPLFTKRGQSGNLWMHASVSFTSSAPFRLVFIGSLGTSYFSDMAIDDVLLEPGQCIPTAHQSVVDCTSQGMTITFNKRDFYYLPDSLSLNDAKCTSSSNATHIWLYTDYNACSTEAQVKGSDLVYSNTVYDSTTVGGIQFFDAIKIPFQCQISLNKTMSRQFNQTASELIMRVNASSPSTERLVLLDGSNDYSPVLSVNEFKHGEKIYAKLSSNSSRTLLPSYCDVFSQDRTASQRIINNGSAAGTFVKVLQSNKFRFSYPAFTFKSKSRQLTLECKSKRKAFLSKSSGPIVSENTINDIANNKYAGKLHATILDPTTNNISLLCERDAMKLTINPSALYGISVYDLQPLKARCRGFSARVENGYYVYTVPLVNCGGQVSETDDTVVYENTLIYAQKMISQLHSFTDVFLTHSCSYPAALTSVSYTVQPQKFITKTVTQSQSSVDFGLNLFTDEALKKMLNTGAAVSIAEGKKLFGNIKVTSDDPNTRVALNDCRITHVRGRSSYPVLKDGCKTAYGMRVLAPSKYSVLTGSFVGVKDQLNIHLHCSVIVCNSSNLSRCERKCPSSVPSGGIFG